MGASGYVQRGGNGRIEDRLMATPDSELKAALLSARTDAEIWPALWRVEWRRMHPGTDCPDEQIPDPDCPPPTVCSVDPDFGTNPLRGALANEIHDALSALLSAPVGCRLAVVYLPEPPHHWAMAFRVADNERSGMWPIAAVHRTWAGMLEAPRSPHPWAPVIRDRLTPNLRRVRYHGGDGRGRIFPAGLVMTSGHDSRAGKLLLPAAHLNPDSGEGRQLILPGFGRERKLPALPLALYHLGLGHRAPGQQGQGAPVALRLFIESVLAYPYGERDEHGDVRLDTTLSALMRTIWPEQPPRSANMRRLWVASAALDLPEARIPFLNPGGRSSSLRRVVDILDIPDRFDPEAPVVFRVALPPGVGDGPTIPKALNAWGARSAAAYNLLINLAFEWHQPGKLRKPVRRGRHWLPIQDPARYPDLNDDDLIDLCFPDGGAKRRRVLLSEAKAALGSIVTAGGVRVVHGSRSTNRKLLPPPPGQMLLPPPKRRKRSA